jgi:o-succinylbenzoate synthase
VRAELQTLHANIETVGNAKQRWRSRSSVRLILDDDDGHVGLGEAAPLPGMSPETTRDAFDALSAVEWPEEPLLELDEIARVVESVDPGVPSARFAVETALTSLAASVEGLPMWAMWCREVSELPIAATLWGADVDSVLQSAREAAAYEVLAVKLKIGQVGEWREQDLLRKVREIVGPVDLRLDANQSLDPDTLEAQLEAFVPHDPAFLEEPCDLERVLELEEAPFPLAVDESLVGDDTEATLERALSHDPIGVVVLKPSLLGGLERCRRLAERAREAGRAVVVSHLMEGTIARAGAAHLALALGGELAAGLGDHPALLALSDGLTAGWIDLAWIEPPEAPGLGLELAW